MMTAKGQVMGDQLSVANAMLLSITNEHSTLLSQNVPNPFNHTTKINYILPQQFNSAQIVITDKMGKTIKAENISESGKVSLTIDATALASGTCHYSLYVNGKMIDSRQMEHLK